jgi:hypothetical protein
MFYLMVGADWLGIVFELSWFRLEAGICDLLLNVLDYVEVALSSVAEVFVLLLNEPVGLIAVNCIVPPLFGRRLRVPVLFVSKQFEKR